MNIKQITYMAAVVEHGSLSAASKSLYVTVQAVSKAIADLERELGRDLFVRESRGVHPTVFGYAFYERAVEVVRDFNALAAYARKYDEVAKGLGKLRLALNTPPFAGNEIVRENTVAFIAGQLGVKASMDLATAEAGPQGLRDGRYDILITVGLFDDPRFECCVIGTIPPGVMMRQEHPLSRRESVTLADLEPYPVALSSWFAGANVSIASVYRERAANLRFVDLALEDIGRHFDEGGLVLTTGIPAMERAHANMTLKLLAAEDAVPVPLCAVFLKKRSAELRPLAEKIADSSLLGR